MPERSKTAQTLPNHTRVTENPEYDVTIHPSVVRNVAVMRRDGPSRELFRQREVHRVSGEGVPKVWVFQLEGGERDLELRISDPLHHIASIRIELRPSDYDPSWGDIGVPAQETVVVETGAKTCPPYCEV